MIKKIKISKREFKRKLADKTFCAIQYTGWTCGTCFYGISKKLNNRDWNALLLYRGDYKLKDTNQWLEEKGEKPFTKEEIKERIIKIWELIQ